MDRLKRWVLILLFLLAAAHAFCERRGISIDWQKMELSVSGTGTVVPKGSGNTVEWQFDAARLAEQDLFKNFISSMNSLKVDAYNTARELLTKDIQKNELLYNYCDKVKTYSIAYDENHVYITKKYPFFGSAGFMHILLRAGDDTGHFPEYDEWVYTASFTGLVIDARGLGKTPAVAPRIFDEDHNLVYSPALMLKESFEQWGEVQYTDDPYYEGFEERVGKNPFRIVAAPNDKLIETDIGIYNEDAKVLLQHEETKRSLMEGRVILIIDTLKGIE